MPVTSTPARLPLVDTPELGRTLVWRDGGEPISVGAFLASAAALAGALPGHAAQAPPAASARDCWRAGESDAGGPDAAGSRPAMINLCEDRYRFLVALAAAVLREQTVLLPAARAKHVVDEVAAANPGAYRCDDAQVDAWLASVPAEPAAGVPAVAARHVAVRGYTSGSTGCSKPHDKRWGAFVAGTAHNAAAIRAALARRGEHARAAILATVPPQHMYGMETSVLLPLVGDMSVHAARPLFPADVARALAELPAPRVLVTTPVHLRALVESQHALPPIALVVSATAALDSALARAAEAALATEVLEVFGSTETCVIATRRTATETAWHLYDGVTLIPEPDGTRVQAAWYDQPNLLQDVVDLAAGRTFVLRGRNADLLEIAGKRASLAELTRRVLAVPGVTDAVVFQPDAAGGAVRRVAALVVAPGLASRDIAEQLRAALDPAFLPRPLRVVERLPRNEVGKLPREALLAALARD